MSKKLVRLISILLVLAVVMSLSVACGKNETPPTEKTAVATTDGTKETEKPKAPELYTIKALFPGDTPQQFSDVIAEVEKQTKDILNVKLDFQFIPWADYGEKVKIKLAAGDDFDLHLNAPWLHMNQMITAKTIQAWDPYLEQYGQAVIKAFPKAMIDANKFDGKIMGIPLGNVLAGPGFLSIRGDLREKYGLGKVTTLDDLDVYMRKVKENEKGIIPLNWEASNWIIGVKTDPGYVDLGQSSVSVWVHTDENGQLLPIVPIYEDPYFVEWCTKANEWYKEGLIAKDVMMTKDQKGAFISGKSAVANCDGFDQDKLAANVPEGKIENVMFKKEGQKIAATFQMWNFVCLNSKCKDPERVTKFYNWIFEDQKNYDIFAYGIKDKHWVDTGDMTYKLPDGIDANTNYAFPGYVLIWNPNFERLNANWTQDYRDYLKFCNDANNFITSPLVGFNADFEPVKNEIAKVSAIWPETILSLAAGIFSLEKDLPAIKTKLENAGYNKVVDELKKQVEEHMKK